MTNKHTRSERRWFRLFGLLIGLIMIWQASCYADGKTYNVAFVREDLPVVFHTMAVLGDVNIVFNNLFEKEASQKESSINDSKITIQLNAVTFDEAMDLITRSKGLTYHYIGEKNILVEKDELASLRTIKLQNVMAEDIKKTLTGSSDGLKVKVDLDSVSNSLLLSGSQSGVERMKAMIDKLDVMSQQVELEAKVVALSKSATKDLGVDWKWDSAPKTADYSTSFSYDPTGNYDSNGNMIYSRTQKTTITRNSTLSNPGVIQFGKDPEGHPYEFYYQATISALVSNGEAKVLAKPKITTVSGKEAHILIGDRIPVQTQNTQNGQTITTVQYVDAGIKLIYTPVVLPDGQIFAKVHTEVSTPELVSDIKQYKISTREAETNVRVKDGETMVIGGLIGNQTSETISKVPFLSDLPILGALFKSVHNAGSDTEIVIFLTAHVVK